MKKKKAVRTKKEKTKKVDPSSSSLQPEIISPCEPSPPSSSLSHKEDCKHNTNPYLSDDVMTEIFLRLPFESILKFRYISKLWFSQLVNPSFIMRWMRYKGFSAFCPYYFFYKLDSPINESVSIVSSDPCSTQLLSKLDGFSFKFIPSKPVPPKAKKENIYLLASSNGLVLGLTKIYYEHRYFVCNPLTKQFVLLPLHDKANVNLDDAFHGFFCECESSSSSLTTKTTNYKVVRIRESGNWRELNLEIFSSVTSTWKRHVIRYPEVVCNVFKHANVVCSFGVLYWIELKNKIVAYDLFNNNNNRKGTISECRLINLPNPTNEYSDNYCLGKSLEGFIVYAEFVEGELRIWELEDNISTWTWHSVHKIKIWDMLPKNTADWLFGDSIHSYWSVKSLEPLALNLVDQNVVIFGNDWSVFAYNMETRIIKLLSSDYYRSTTSKVMPFVLAPWPTTLRSPFHR